jgi:hypothetical protein
VAPARRACKRFGLSSVGTSAWRRNPGKASYGEATQQPPGLAGAERRRCRYHSRHSLSLLCHGGDQASRDASHEGGLPRRSARAADSSSAG